MFNIQVKIWTSSDLQFNGTTVFTLLCNGGQHRSLESFFCLPNRNSVLNSSALSLPKPCAPCCFLCVNLTSGSCLSATSHVGIVWLLQQHKAVGSLGDEEAPTACFRGSVLSEVNTLYGDPRLCLSAHPWVDLWGPLHFPLIRKPALKVHVQMYFQPLHVILWVYLQKSIIGHIVLYFFSMFPQRAPLGFPTSHVQGLWFQTFSDTWYFFFSSWNCLLGLCYVSELWFIKVKFEHLFFGSLFICTSYIEEDLF